jgi:tRNA 2-thiouridine synthesizing protein E
VLAGFFQELRYTDPEIEPQLQPEEKIAMADSMRDILNPGLATAADPSFPHAPEDWSPKDGQATASAEGLELGERHWEAVRALQEYFAKNESVNVRELHDALDERFHGRGGLRFLYELFPGGPVAQGCRVAGLQPPAGSTDQSFGSVQ